MEEDKLLSSLEENKWSRVHTLYFISFAIGLFIEGFLFVITSAATTWYVIPRSLKVLLLGWPFIWLIIGMSTIGPISDKLGRKRTWIYTMTLYAIGGVILLFSVNYVLVLIALAILVASAGGEMNIILTMAHEMFPRRHRSKSVMLLQIFNGAVAGIVASILGFIAISTTIIFERYLTALTIFLALVALITVRMKTPESIRWLEKTGKHEQAKEETEKYFKTSPAITTQTTTKPSTSEKKLSTWTKLLILTPIGWANSSGYGLIMYTLGPLFFPKAMVYIFLFVGIGAFAGGLLGIFGDRWSRKKLLLGTYWILLFIAVLYLVGFKLWTTNLLIFATLLVTTHFVEQPSYAAIETLKGEVWPTKMRGSLTALARALPLILYLPVLYFASLLSLYEYVIFYVIIWAIGAVGTAAWYIWGYETGKGVSIKIASGE